MPSSIDFLSDPNNVYILFILGLTLIHLEVQTVGGFIAGTLGFLAISLSALGFQSLSFNGTAMLLMITGSISLISEIYIISYGLLTLLGLSLLAIGSFNLFPEVQGNIGLNPILILSTIGSVAIFTALTAFFLWRTRRNPNDESFFDLEGKVAHISQIQDKQGSLHQYQVKIEGEIWAATSASQFELGQEVLVDNHIRDGLILTIIQLK